MIESLYNDRTLFPDDTSIQQGEVLCHKSRKLTRNTIFGKIKLTRTYFYHSPSKTGRFPLDEKLGLEGHYTPALARLVCRAASMSSSFSPRAEDLSIFAGIEVCPRQFGRLADSIDPGLEKALAENPLEIMKAQAMWEPLETAVRLPSYSGRRLFGAGWARREKSFS